MRVYVLAESSFHLEVPRVWLIPYLFVKASRKRTKKKKEGKYWTFSVANFFSSDESLLEYKWVWVLLSFMSTSCFWGNSSWQHCLQCGLKESICTHPKIYILKWKVFYCFPRGLPASAPPSETLYEERVKKIFLLWQL